MLLLASAVFVHGALEVELVAYSSIALTLDTRMRVLRNTYWKAVDAGGLALAQGRAENT